jgi:cobaltochelatase CobT
MKIVDLWRDHVEDKAGRTSTGFCEASRTSATFARSVANSSRSTCGGRALDRDETRTRTRAIREQEQGGEGEAEQSARASGAR